MSPKIFVMRLSFCFVFWGLFQARVFLVVLEYFQQAELLFPDSRGGNLTIPRS